MKLVQVLPGHWLDETAAPSFLAWHEEITRQLGGPPAVTECYRSPARQDELYAGWIARKDGYNPAYKSTDPRARHIRGKAVDWGFAGRKIARATAHLYGWAFNVSNEEWHAECVDTEIYKRQIKSVPAKPITEDDEMLRLIRRTKDGTIAAVSYHTGYYWHVPQAAYADLMRARKVCYNEPPIELAENEWEFIVNNLLPDLRRNSK